MKDMKQLFTLCFVFVLTSAKSITLLHYKYACSPIPTNSWYSGSIPCTPTCFGDQTIILQLVFNEPSPGGAIGVNPYRMKVEVFDASWNIIGSNQMDAPSPAFSPTFFLGSIMAGNIQGKVLLQKRTLVGWVNVNTYWSNILVKDACPPPPCNMLPPVTITGTYTTSLKESSAWIKTSGTTIIPGSAIVALDADASSYVELNPGFETQVNSRFVAEAFNGCTSGAPQALIINDNELVDNNIIDKSEKIESENERMAIYPNPTNGIVTISHSANLKEIKIYNLTGTLILTIPTDENSETKIDLSDQPQGTYIIITEGQTPQQIVKL